MDDLRIVFFGTPDFAVASFKALVEAGFKVVGAVTAPDKPSGRGQKLQSPPVKIFADECGIPCLQPVNLKSPDFIESLAAFKADLQIVVAFRMLPEIVWNMPKLGTYNVHASLLPDYRGAAPINWAIINGEKETGVTTFKLKHEIDTGSVLLQKKVEIGYHDNAGDLHDKLMLAGAELLVQSVQLIESGQANLTPQRTTERDKHAPKIFKDTCQINWDQSAESVRNFIRGMSPFPAAYTGISFKNEIESWKFFDSKVTEKSSKAPAELQIENNQLFIACSDYWLEILELQAPGRKRINASDFLRGIHSDMSSIQLVKI